MTWGEFKEKVDAEIGSATEIAWIDWDGWSTPEIVYDKYGEVTIT